MLAKSHVYALLDPRDNAVRYVGQSVKPSERIVNHLCEARKGTDFHSYRWMRQLLSLGLRPQMVILETVSVDQIDATEQRWIAHYRAQGASLTNHTDGGGGMRGYKLSPQHIERLVASNKGKKRSDETRARFREIQNDPAMKAHLSEKRKGNKSRTGQRQTAEEKERRAAANRGKKRSPEFCEAMRQRMLGTTQSEDTRRKMAETKRATMTPERRSEIARIANLASQEAKRCRSRNV